MATQTNSAGVSTNHSWKCGVLAGISGGVVMAVVMLAMGANNVLGGAIPALYGLAPPLNPAAGLVVHISHGAVLGVVFAGILGAVGLDEPAKVVGAGVVYGVVAAGVFTQTRDL